MEENSDDNLGDNDKQSIHPGVVDSREDPTGDLVLSYLSMACFQDI